MTQTNCDKGVRLPSYQDSFSSSAFRDSTRLTSSGVFCNRSDNRRTTELILPTSRFTNLPTSVRVAHPAGNVVDRQMESQALGIGEALIHKIVITENPRVFATVVKFSPLCFPNFIKHKRAIPRSCLFDRFSKLSKHPVCGQPREEGSLTLCRN